MRGLFEERPREACKRESGHERLAGARATAPQTRSGPSSFGHARRSALVTLLAAQGPCEPTRGGARARSGKNRTSRGDDGAARVAAAVEQGACGGRTAVSRVRVGRLANPADAEEPERGALHQCGRLPVRGHPAESSWMDACCAALRAFCALNSRVMRLRAQRTPQARSGQAACSLFLSRWRLAPGVNPAPRDARSSPPPSRLLLRTRSSPLAAWFTRGLALSGAASSAVALLMALC